VVGQMDSVQDGAAMAVLVLSSDYGVPLSSEPKRTLSPFFNRMGRHSPSVHDNSWKFPNRRVGEPDLVIVPTENRLFAFWLYTY
jgi:hypothetical protein